MTSLRNGLRRLADNSSYRAALRQLKRSDQRESVQLRDALERGWRGRLDAEEQAWVTRIEALRERVDRSTEIIRTTGPEWSADPADGRIIEVPLGHLSRTASKRPLSARVLFSLIRAVQPSNCLELGSCVGISAAYQAAALTMNGTGRLVSFEASRERIDTADRHLRELGLDNVQLVPGRFQDTLDDALHALPGPVDYAFIDGHHSEAATVEYFREILPFAAPSAIFVFDDIHWSPGMERAWETLASDDAVAIAVDVRDMGIAVGGASR